MIFIIIGIGALILILWLVNRLKVKYVVDLFRTGNTLTGGLKGAGKDLLYCIVINERKENYISNVEYSDPNAKFKRFEFSEKVWELAGNDFHRMINDEIVPYTYPYPDGIDYYISDMGIYFPSQYQGDLVKRYKGAPMFQALSRHLGDCAVHGNSQNIKRIWDKIREQGDIYIRMHRSRVYNVKIPLLRILIPKLAHVKMYVYEREEACEAGIIPPFFGIGNTARTAKYNFEIAHGKIKKVAFWHKLPYVYDSRRFKKILENGCRDYENEKEINNGRKN